MTITVTKKDNIVSIDLKNETNGNDLNLKLTPEDARELAAKIFLAITNL